MAKIGISLDGILRDYLSQFAYTYEKYYGTKIDFEKNPITEYDFVKYLKSIDENSTKTKNEIYDFMFGDGGLTIAGHADQLHDNIMSHFNLFLIDIADDEEHEIELVSREYGKSIPGTLFFLSKLSCMANKIRFVKNYEEKWDGLDILITANPIALESKPKNKISIKINTTYNKNIKADFELDSIVDFFKDESLRNKILNTKITNYEEIKD